MNRIFADDGDAATGEGSIRPCEMKDLDELLAVERLCYPRPWSERQFLDELQAPHAYLDLLQLNDRLAGYICYWLAAGELHILNVATAPAFRRRKVAQRLVAHAMDQARQRRAERACLEVRRANHGAIALYRSLGFENDCIRRGYYSDGEDALLMSCPLQIVVEKEPGDQE